MSNILKQFDVLYIEGDIKAQENLIPILESNFNDLYIASNGFEAVSIFDQYMDKIDLVIVDIDIDTISGLDVANVIKQANQDIKVIVLSDVSNTEYFVEAIRINVDSFLLKPFDDTSLIDEATTLLENRVKNIILQDTQDLNKHYEKILDEIALVSKTDIAGKITYVNKLFCDTSAYEEKKLLGNTHKILRDPLTPKVVYQRLWKTISSGDSWNGKITNVSKCGLKYTSNAFIAPLFDSETKEINGYISVSFLIDKYELESKKMVTYIDKIQKEKNN